MTRKTATIAIVGVLAALTVALGLLWERGTVADRASSVGGGGPEGVDAGRGVHGGGAVPEATQQEASSEVAGEGISAEAPALIAAQADQLADYVRGELEEYRPQWPANEHQQYADAVREAILATAERPLSGAEIREFKRSFHELASNLCFHNRPGKIEVVKREGLWGRHVWTRAANVREEVRGLGWMTRCWLVRKRKPLSQREQDRLEEQLSRFDATLSGLVRRGVAMGMDAEYLARKRDEALQVRNRARSNALWPNLKVPLLEKVFGPELESFERRVSRALSRWRGDLEEGPGWARWWRKWEMGSTASYTFDCFGSYDGTMNYWGCLHQPDVEQPASISFWLRGCNDVRYGSVVNPPVTLERP